MFGQAFFGLGLSTTHISVDGWRWLLELVDSTDHDASSDADTEAFDGFWTDDTGYATTEVATDTDDDRDADSPQTPLWGEDTGFLFINPF